MAEKKFRGAPFGTQTARFDVTGVHPKTKVPGTFTQIPYDKNSILELSSGQTETVDKHQNGTDETLKSQIYRSKLISLRAKITSARQQMESINHLKTKLASRKRSKSQPSLLKEVHSKFEAYKNGRSDGDIKIKEKLPCKKNGHRVCTSNLQTKAEPTNTDTSGTKDKRSDPLLICSSEKSKDLGTVPKSLTPLFSDYMSIEQEGGVLDSENRCCSNDEDMLKLDENMNKWELDTSQNAGSIGQEQSMFKRVSFLGEGFSGIPQDINSLTRERPSDLSFTQEFLYSEMDDIDQMAVPSKDNLGNDIDSEHDLKCVTSFLERVSKKYSKKFSFEDPSKKKEQRYSSITQHVSAILLQEDAAAQSKLVREEKTTSASEQRLLKQKSGSCEREMKKQQQINLKKKHDELKRKMGPGAYNTVVGGFSPASVEQKSSGPGWARQLEVERLAALPHLLHKEQWEENKMLKRKLGPGSYEIKDFIQAGMEKPRSERGICQNLAPRFEKGPSSATPGPGTYGMGGVPQRALEEKDFKSTSTKGMLDAGDRKRNLPSVGSHLGPGTYNHKTCTDELINKVTSLKGPYELYSGDRNKPISEGYLAAPKLADLGPGQYEIGSFVDELNSTHKRIHGRFGKMAQYSDVPTERIFHFSKAHYPKTLGSPGPGTYSAELPSSKSHATNSPGFLSSAKRDDKMSQKFFTRNFNPVGAGRYDIQKFEEAQDINGHTSVFRSKTGKPNLAMSKFLQERIRSKDVPVQDRVFLTSCSQPTRMTRSITVM